MYVILKALEGPYAGKTRTILLKAPKYTCRFGRTVSDEEFLLDEDPEISGHHATFKWSVEKDCLQIRDEHSFNGTALDSKVLEPGKSYSVVDGSVLFAGKSKFLVCVKEHLEESKRKETEPSATIKDEGSNEVPSALYCPICYRDLHLMTVTGRTQHVNNCLGRGETPKKNSEEVTSETAYIAKARQLATEDSFDNMSVPQLSGLIQRMEDAKAKLEIQLQKARVVFYRKRSAEILQRPFLQHTSPSGVREDPGAAIDVMFTQTSECSQSMNLASSSIQARLTGATLIPETVPEPKRQCVESDTLNAESSDDSILSTPLQTPTRNRRCSLPISPSRGVPRVSSRRSSILVTPTKAAVSPRPLHLSQLERSQRLQFFMKQIPADLPSAEICTQIKTYLSQSLNEIRESRDSLQDQLITTKDEQKKNTLEFLLKITEDIATELETIRDTPTQSRRMTIGDTSLSSPLKSPQKSLPIDLVSPSKTLSQRPTVSEDTINRVKAAIEKDHGLSYLVSTKQIVSFDKLASCVRRSIPSLSSESIKLVFDSEGIKYSL